MEDPADRSKAQPEEVAVEVSAEAAEQHTEPAGAAGEAPSAQAAPPEEQPPAESPVTPPAEHAEPVESVPSGQADITAGDADNQASAQAPEGAPETQPGKKAAPEPPRPRFSDLSEGMVLEGTVTRIERYGAFVNLGLADRREGLIHISELSPHRIRRVEDVVKVGDAVRARVVSIDQERRRIALSLNEIPDNSIPQQAPAPSEPTLTAMQMAFERARSRRREEESQEQGEPGRQDVGSRKKREQESLMRKLRPSGS